MLTTSKYFRAATAAALLVFAASCSDETNGSVPDAGGPGFDAGESMDASSTLDSARTEDADGPDASDSPDMAMAMADMGESADLGADAASGGDMGPDACESPFSPVQNPPSDPPFSGTAFITDDLITDSDPTSFVDLTYAGQAQRTMFDRRVAQFVQLDAHLFDAQFGANKMVEIQVNPEFTQTEAEAEARTYAPVIGRLPAFLFRDIETVWIHAGVEPFGGGNNNLLIHTGQGENYRSGGELEEIFIHEAAHTSMDAYHAANQRWLDAAAADGVALSTYARDNPNREDVAETLGPYLAVRFRPGRIDSQTVQTIEATIPNRVQYFDCLDLSMDVLE